MVTASSPLHAAERSANAEPAASSKPRHGRGQEGRVEAQSPASDLLSTMASIRRRSRFLAGRPTEFGELTASQLDLLRLVHRKPGISVAGAASKLGVAPNTVSTLVRRLCDCGLLIRTADERDRRIARLALTDDMRRKVAEFGDRRAALMAEAISRLSRGDQGRLPELVEVLHRIDGALGEGTVKDSACTDAEQAK